MLDALASAPHAAAYLGDVAHRADSAHVCVPTGVDDTEWVALDVVACGHSDPWSPAVREDDAPPQHAHQPATSSAMPATTRRAAARMVPMTHGFCGFGLR